jgi:hypothetical protein
MCYEGDNGYATVYHLREFRASKLYHCCECGGPIPVGARYERLFMVFDGLAKSYHTHLECAALSDFAIKELCADHGTRMVGGLVEELGEYAEYEVDSEGNDLPGPTLWDIFEAIREGYERQAAA